MSDVFNPFSLEGKSIVITGASSGIGRQCAIDCSKMGARILLLGRNSNRLLEVENSLSGKGHSSISVDVTDYSKVSDLLTQYVTDKGPIDGFIYAAGVERTLPLRNLKPEDYATLYATNYIGCMNILKTLAKRNSYRSGCKVVFIASITSMIARVGTLAYTATKGALVASARELAVELAPKGINVNCISPGTVMTPMMEAVLSTLTEEERQKRLTGFPLGIGKPQDVSAACIYLLSDAARWITGQNLIIDGGYTIK